MNLQDKAYQIARKAAVAVKLVKPLPEMSGYALDVAQIRALRAQPHGRMADAFFAQGQRKVHKWTQYLPVYERYFTPFRDTAVRFLEIGVFDGGSLEMWRRYFGPGATIVGVDINPACADRVNAPNIVRIGSQADRAFLEGVIREFGPFDVILDDGSHIARHQRASLEILFPTLRDGGIYVIEDTHTAYWPDWEGGYRRRGSIIEVVKRMVDDMHGWYHSHAMHSSARDWVDAIHYHDSIIVLDKRSKVRPGFLYSGVAE